MLTARTFDAHPTGVADLFGLRLAILHEADKGRRLAEGTVKRLTGGDKIKARRMREDFWSFEPSHSFVMLRPERLAMALEAFAFGDDLNEELGAAPSPVLAGQARPETPPQRVSITAGSGGRSA